MEEEENVMRLMSQKNGIWCDYMSQMMKWDLSEKIFGEMEGRREAQCGHNGLSIQWTEAKNSKGWEEETKKKIEEENERVCKKEKK